jgi:hypothetical protein
MLRWLDYITDYLDLYSTIKPVYSEQEDGTHAQQIIDYTPSDIDKWKHFITKWNLPDWILSILIDATSE